MMSITPVTLLFTAALALYEPVKKERDLLKWGVLTYFITLSLEAIGTNTGIIFGNYSYGSTLGIKIMNVPLVIGLIWVVLILGAVSLSYSITNNFLARIFTASAITVFLDFFLEQLSGRLKYWSWTGNTVPILNYATWFVITFIAAVSLQLFVKNFHHKILAHFFMGQSIFIIISDLIIK